MPTAKTIARNQEIRDFIIANVAENPDHLTRLVARHFHFSRQAAHTHVRRLVMAKVLETDGSTRSQNYALKTLKVDARTFPLRVGIEAERVWQVYLQPLFEEVAPSITAICEYAFVELFQNAVSYSFGGKLEYRMEVGPGKIELVLADDGVGIFCKIATERHMNETDAALKLFQGRLTTDPRHHAGEGLGFVADAFDSLRVDSGTLTLIHGEPANNLLAGRETKLAGTRFTLVIDPESGKTMEGVLGV